MPSISKLPLPTKEATFPLRFLQDYYEFNTFFNYRTLSKAFVGNNAFESNHLGAIQAVYRKQAPLLEASQVNRPSQVNWFTERLPLSSDASVLDLNCGTGVVSRNVGPKVNKVVGTDISRHLLEFANTKPLENVEYCRAEASELPFEDSTFDVVFSRFSFNHFMNRTEVLNELRRVCKPGGFIALMERVIPDELDEGSTIRMEYIEGVRDPSHVYFMTPAEMNQLFTENEIEVVKKDTTVCSEPLEDYLNQTKVNPMDRAAITQYIYGNMIAPDAEWDQKTGFYPHLVEDVVTVTHHFAMIGGNNPEQKPQKKE